MRIDSDAGRATRVPDLGCEHDHDRDWLQRLSRDHGGWRELFDALEFRARDDTVF
jgi:hypothetical protein